VLKLYWTQVAQGRVGWSANGRLFQKGPPLFETSQDISYFSEEAGYAVVSKLVLKSKFQNLTYVINFDTLVVYETNYYP
jgi:hypothetical protein